MNKKKPQRKKSPVNEYPEAFKRKVVEEYLAKGGTKTILLAKYGIKFRSAIQTWMKQLGYEDIHKNISYFEMKNHIELAAKYSDKPASEVHKTEDLLKEIKELKRQLEDEKLRAEAYMRIIDIAEKELNIPIRKKSNTR